MTCCAPSARAVVPTNDVPAPFPTVGVPLATSGGQFCAQASEQALLVPLSAPKRYTVRPCASTRMSPRLLLATAMVVADARLEVPSVGDAVVLAPVLPQAAVTSASDPRIVPATKVCLRPVMSCSPEIARRIRR